MGALLAIIVLLRQDGVRDRLAILIETERSKSEFVQQVLDTSQESRFPLYDVKIRPMHMREIQALVEHLKDRELMENRDKRWFPMRFYHGGHEYKGKLRLRGDQGVHWSFPKKSWRIKFDSEKLFRGYRTVDFIIPGDRGYEIEKLAYDSARALGLMAPDGGFAQLRINGVAMGLYFWHEKNSKEMLEKLQYPVGEIFRQDNIWTQAGFTGYGLDSDSHGMSLFTSSYAPTIHDTTTSVRFYAERWDHLLNLIRNSNEEQFAAEIPFLIDMEKYLKWNALTWLFGSKHAHWGDNLRWYYDNTKGLFEPIVFDVFRYAIDNRRLGTFEATEHDPLAKKIIRIPEYNQRRNAILWSLVNDSQFDLATAADSIFRNIRLHLFKGPDEGKRHIDAFHRKTLDILEQNQKTIKGNLEFARVFVTPSISYVDGKGLLAIELVPDCLAPIRLESLELVFADGSAALPETSVRFYLTSERREISTRMLTRRDNTLRASFDSLRIWTPLKDDLTPVPRVWPLYIEFEEMPREIWTDPEFLRSVRMTFSNELTGTSIDESYVNQAPLVWEVQRETLQKRFSDIDSFMVRCGLPFEIRGTSLALQEGSYEILEDLIVPHDYSLSLGEGVTLRVAPGICILTYQPLHISGSAEKPVSVLPLERGAPWGALAVINANGMSELNNLRVSGGSEATINGIYLSGQLCFYHSDLVLKNSSIEGAGADDGLNVKKAEVLIQDCTFEGNSADAFDGDWVEGLVERCHFAHNGGDGIDLSGSDLRIRDNLFEGMGDKAISAGERSTVWIFNNVIRDSQFGVAIKDLSTATLGASVLFGNQTAMALYRKKQIFGGGKAEVASSLFWSNEMDFLLDAESTLDLFRVGLESFESHHGITDRDVRVGEIASYYRKTGRAGFIHSESSPKASPFAARAAQVEGLPFADFADKPIGLSSPLSWIHER